ncbi:MAG: hypothetical protein KC776_35425 [Myxococcales bacterium]|nr:hypothetical protein [Myxococcales bacterium]MCB9578639.1 hypothetical protein [Polyangiaceae bacterium]
MVTLTCAELSAYPGSTDTERELAHHAEQRQRPKRLGTTARPQRIDLRPFPGRDRGERIANYLIAHVPRAATWSPEALRELAGKLAQDADIIE